jgi:hypothetical protein
MNDTNPTDEVFADKVAEPVLQERIADIRRRHFPEENKKPSIIPPPDTSAKGPRFVLWVVVFYAAIAFGLGFWVARSF